MPDALVRPESGLEALSRWRPDIPASDSAGECSLERSQGNGATSVIAYFPARSNPVTTVRLSFDSAGTLVRFSENSGHGTNRIVMPPGITTASQRDSVLRARLIENRRTVVTLDFAMDEGMAMNAGGNAPGNLVRGSVRAMENAENFGPPKARIARVRRLCGV